LRSGSILILQNNFGKYSLSSRLIHRLFLGSKIVRRLSFDLDVARGNLGHEHPYGPIFICGSARSGTTILLRILAKSNDLVAQTYRDMPFVMAPRFREFFQWNAGYKVESVERIHGDGLRIGFDSPEAFEEIFWLTQDAANVTLASYCFNPPSSENISDFKNFRLLVCADKGGRYVSKNNANVGRLETLQKIPNATVLFLFRDPAATASSLMRLHNKLCGTHASNAFVAEYMAMLGHFEFGPNHRPFDFAVPFQDASMNPSQPDYWLDYWSALHTGILSNLRYSNVKLLAYEDLISDPVIELKNLATNLKIELDPFYSANIIKQTTKNDASFQFSEAKLMRAEFLYNQLLRQSRTGAMP
jgi:Sulfotransferase family